MYQRYRERSRRRREYNSNSGYRRWRMSPTTQLLIVAIAALVVYIIRTSGAR